MRGSRGGQRVRTPPPTLENHKHIGLLYNTGTDPIKITKLQSMHSMLGHHRPRSILVLSGRNHIMANASIYLLFGNSKLLYLFVLLLNVASQQLWAWRCDQFTKPHIFLGKHEQAVNQCFVHILSFVTDNNPS